MIGNSLESTVKIMQIHLDNHLPDESVSNFKSRMYQTMYPELKTRLKSHGWEKHNTSQFNILTYKIDLVKQLKLPNQIFKFSIHHE
jgi:hypothetical protein